MKRKDQKQVKSVAPQKTESNQHKEKQKTALGKKRTRLNKPFLRPC